MPREFIRALGLIKSAAAQANADLGHLAKNKAKAIRKAAERVAAGEFDEQFPDRRVPDRFGHVVEHECERGDRARRDAVGHESASERRREQWPVVERRDSDGDPCERRAHGFGKAVACARASEEDARQAREGIEERREDRPHAFDGCDAGDVRSGIGRMVGADRIEHRASARCVEARAPVAARRHGGRHRHQRGCEARSEDLRRVAQGDRREVRVVAEIFSKACRRRMRQSNCPAS